MNFGFKFIILFLGIVFKDVLGQLEEGDLCTISSSGVTGICKLTSLCPVADQTQQTGSSTSPKNCGLKNNEEMVCCAGAVGDKSKQKCTEYGQLGYEYQDLGVIEGVTPAKAKEFPHVALLGFEGDDKDIQPKCSGSLISKKFVLSSAICTHAGNLGSPKYVLLGDLVLDSSSDDSKPQKILIKNIIRHPEFHRPSAYNDIALFELESEAELNAYVRPACLNTNPSLTISSAVNSGWGTTTGHYSDVSKEMLKVSLDIFTTSECNNTYWRPADRKLPQGIIEEILICAGSRNESKEICQGSSGSPLQIMNTEVVGTYKIIGISSFGRGCARINNPSVYTRVSGYIKWIEDIVWP